MASELLNSLVSGILVETSWGPPIMVEDPFKPLAPGETSTADVTGQLMKPKITVYLRTGDKYVSSPYGDPGPTKWGFVQVGLALAALGGLWLLLRGVRKRRLAR